MSWLHLTLLALIQGLTEFLPVSSSAHLILPAKIFGWQDQGPLIDVMAHFGSLFAVIAYFRKDVGAIFIGLLDLIKGKLNVNSTLALNLIIATPPALLLGAALRFSGWDELIRSPFIIACTTIVFGILLWLSDIWGKQTRTTEDLTWRGAFGLGLAQAIALIPGTSRSGITMTAARSMGFTRTEAARFSMLMSLPIIGVGGLFALYSLSSAEPAELAGASLADGLWVAFLSFIAAFACISVFMKWISRIGMLPFMLYRLALGGALLAWIMLT
ncbi:undecaprenyl-diphosphatase [Litorimonas taeanensis]|uniref:Undecaprenyl-diphosphatase n=1 Tax=Litorimonas taeanensis TaxID=568099 RepID=A0A420WKW5_9PROT|nr:undecaprenyl-diphosphate phosphatase [Litorimonas taeanensis]RKQ71667.1 undecaprenyl-diphosphatase [Litorimonas taeanensis]